VLSHFSFIVTPATILSTAWKTVAVL